MTQVLLIRHAETDLKGTFCGHSDPGLNDAGRAQLPVILERLGGLPIKFVISSDLRRASETATLIAQQFNIKSLTRPDLREIYFGDWEGLTWQQIEARDPGFAQCWHQGFPRIAIPGGESLAKFETRIAGELDFLRTLPAGHATVVVTHGGVLRTMLKMLGKPVPDQIAYGEVIQCFL